MVLVGTKNVLDMLNGVAYHERMNQLSSARVQSSNDVNSLLSALKPREMSICDD